LIIAIFSTMLAATFGLGRMIRSLADAGQAPSFLIEKREIPVRGILFSGTAMLAAVGLGYLLPKGIYIFLVSSGGFSLLFAYLIILVTHYKFRIRNGCPPKGNCQMPGFPYTSWAAILALIIIIATMPLVPGQGSGLFAGILLILFYMILYFIWSRISV
jgi:AAT family amino acid transporter